MSDPVTAPDLLTVPGRNKIKFDIVSDINTLVALVKANHPDALLIIEEEDSPDTAIKRIRKQKVFDAIPILGFPDLEVALSWLQSYS